MGFGEIGIALRIICIVALVIVAIFVIVANVLIDFALNLKAPYTMKAMIDGGGTPDALDLSLAHNDAAEEAAANAWYKESHESIELVAQDGAKLYGDQITSPSNNHRYAVFCHGYTADPSTMAKYAHHFYQRGYSVVLPTARGHERNIDTGYIQMGWQDSKDLVGWVNQIASADPEAKIVLMGVSMGGAEVMMASGWDMPKNLKCVVEDCGYSSVWDEFHLQIGNIFHLPAFPLLNFTSFFCKLRAGYTFKEASAAKQLAKARVPMLFIHGTNDMFVPYSNLQVNFDACASADKRMLTVEGAPHGMAASQDPKLYWSTIDAFVDARI